MTDINAFARATPWLHGIMYGYATYGVALFAVFLVAGLWLARRSGDPARMAAALWAGVGTLVAVGVNQPIVNAVHEARPYTTTPGLLVLADRSTDYSFPSDHATMAGALAVGLLLVHRRLAAVTTVAALLLAFSRVYIAAHYPRDVAVGLILGGLVVLVGWFLIRRPATALIRKLETTPVRRLLTTTPAETR
ncbi:phosphatase PAP2 family protein [Amycolatopsis sp. K13G38]|uniref:Phosphatase PAP2 family protein n=1 Tax=Amycolatopsis acididurans TaxID=2724524 RepID=A0ABX1J8E2_9PSEU|nr:phosphatase PAP2 family protein [Amycolatopsis acididurans]NKQ56070.1 phosphatase PAP2 family protein [Amycolatopsis acididurans]